VATSGLEETEDADADPEAGMLTTGDICLRKVSTVLSPLAQREVLFIRVCIHDGVL